MRKYAIWVREYGIMQVHYVEAEKATEALDKMTNLCRRLSFYPGSMHIVKIMEVVK